MNTLLCILIFNFSFKPFYYTNHNYYYAITSIDSLIYGATNGGVVRYNYKRDEFAVLTNSDGLQKNRQNCIALDSAGFVWVGNDLGLAQINKEFNRINVYPVNCLPCSRVHTIFCLKDTILVGTESGLLLIDTRGTSDNFSDDLIQKIYDTNGLISNNITTIGADSDFWIGTTDGVTRFSKDFLVYSNYTIAQGLLDNYINKIFVFDTNIFVATKFGINQFVGDHFDTILSGYFVKDIDAAGDSLLLALDTTNQFGILFQGSLQIIKENLPYRTEINDVENINGVFVCALGNRYSNDYFGDGIGFFDTINHRWNSKKDNCLGSNHICDISANQYGVFVALGRRSIESKGFAWLTDNGFWINYTKDSILPSNHIHRCAISRDGRVWFGINSFGPLDTVQALALNPITKELYFLRKGYKGMDSTVAIWDIEFDLHNNLYLSLAGPSDKIWVIDSTLSHPTFIGERTPGFEVELAIDSEGRVYSTVTGAEGGLLLIDTKGTIYDRGDDESFKFGESDGLISKYAWGCVLDKNDILYIANESGLSIYDKNSFTGIRNFSSGEVFDVEMDNVGRVWMMTRSGIYYYDPIYRFHQGWEYNTLGIDIEFLPVSSEVIQIQGFEFDSLRNCFWLGGETGLLKLSIEADSPNSLDSVVIYPNPAIAGRRVNIKKIPQDATVNIYSISGRALEKGLQPNEFGEIFWEIPENISNGLYFVFVNSTAGKGIYKLAIIK
ncbi:MAG: T9SS type A sorting domain-containing protein [candidate division WOR-3 bacterium]